MGKFGRAEREDQDETGRRRGDCDSGEFCKSSVPKELSANVPNITPREIRGASLQVSRV
jgi:hypothetical protein